MALHVCPSEKENQTVRGCFISSHWLKVRTSSVSDGCPGCLRWLLNHSQIKPPRRLLLLSKEVTPPSLFISPEVFTHNCLCLAEGQQVKQELCILHGLGEHVLKYNILLFEQYS